MNSSKLKVALIISLVFNVAVLGAFAFGWVRQSKARKYERVRKERFERPSARRFHRLSKHVGLPEEKAQQIEQIMMESDEKVDELKATLRERRKELADLLIAGEPDENEVMAKVDEIAALQGELEKLLVQRLLRVHSVLDKEEREKFMELIRRKMVPRHRGRMHHPEYMHHPGYMHDSVSTPPGKEGSI